MSRRGRVVATTKPKPPKEKQPTRWGAITGSNTCARRRRGEPTGEIFEGIRRFW
jgi:hypothetical protein